MTKLFATGCSFTWGGGIEEYLYDSNNIILDELNSSDQNQRRLNVTWPGKLSKLLNCTEFYNYSIGGGSNDRIVRKTTNFFIDKIHNNENLSDWIVIIQWTVPHRFEFFDSESKSWGIVLPEFVCTENKRYFDKKESEKILSSFFWNTDEAWQQKQFNDILLLGSFLKTHNIKYFFTSMCPLELKSSHEDYCSENFVWYNNNLKMCSIESMQNIDRCKKSPHPSEIGHTQISENFYNFITNKLKDIK